jgi:hypothetical protein
MKITKSMLKQIIKEEYQRAVEEMRDPPTFDRGGEYSGRGAAGENVMSSFRNEEVGRLFPKFKARIERLVAQQGPEQFKHSLAVINKVEMGQQLDMEEEFLILGI